MSKRPQEDSWLSAKDTNDTARTLMAGLASYPADVIEALAYELHNHLCDAREAEAIARLRETPLTALLVHATWFQEKEGGVSHTALSLRISNHHGGLVFAGDELQGVVVSEVDGAVELCDRSASWSNEAPSPRRVDQEHLVPVLRALHAHWSAFGIVEANIDRTLVVTGGGVYSHFSLEAVRDLILEGVSREMLAEALNTKWHHNKELVTPPQICAVLDADPILGREALLSGRFEIGRVERELIDGHLSRSSANASGRLKERMR